MPRSWAWLPRPNIALRTPSIWASESWVSRNSCWPTRSCAVNSQRAHRWATEWWRMQTTDWAA